MNSLIKCFTILGALFILIFGCGLLAATIYFFVNNSIFLNNTTVQNTVLGVTFGASLAIIGGAIQGMIGICKERSGMVCIFQIFVIIFMGLFIGLGVAIIFAPGIIFQGTCETSTNPVIGYANEIYTLSKQILCSPACPCQIDTTTAAFNNTYNPTQKALINNDSLYNLSSSGANSSSDCQDIKNQLQETQVAMFGVLGDLQQLIDCSLWCNGDPNTNLIFRFSNVNDGLPANFCYDRIVSLFDQYKSVGMGCMFGAGGVMTLMFLCNMYLCCCAEQRRGQNARDRFVYIVDKRDDTGGKYDRFNQDPYKRGRNEYTRR